MKVTVAWGAVITSLLASLQCVAVAQAGTIVYSGSYGLSVISDSGKGPPRDATAIKRSRSVIVGRFDRKKCGGNSCGRYRRVQIDNPQWSPDGKRLLYEGTKKRIWLARANGKGRRVLAVGGGAEWLPGGTEVSYTTAREFPLGDRYDCFELFLGAPPESKGGLEMAINIFTGATRVLSTLPDRNLSPDGQWTYCYGHPAADPAFTDNAMLRISRADGSEPRYYQGVDNPEFGALYFPNEIGEADADKLEPLYGWVGEHEWAYLCASPNGTRRCFFDAATGAVRVGDRLRTTTALNGGEDAFDAALSPSGDRFALTTYKGLYTVPVSGGHREWLVRNRTGFGSTVPDEVDWKK